MTYHVQQKVLFKHCDPAGIVFYPRYFEMMNDCVEAFFDDVLGVPFETLHGHHAVPTAQIETRFEAPSRHGDRLDLALRLTAVGASSLGYQMTAACDGEPRFTTHATIVYVNDRGRPERWPDAMRAIFTDILEGDR
jgi:4-hydroxybenzoyl-CoA thioesterase